MVTTVVKLQQTTPEDTHALQVKLQLLEQENAHLKTEKALLEKNLDDVRQAMLLIESRPSPLAEQQPAPVAKKSWQFWKK